MQDFRNLAVWQKAHRLTLEVLAISATFARPPFYALQNQAIRAAMSIPANLAEGAGRTGDREFRRSLGWRWAQPVNLSIIYFLPGISGWSRRRPTIGSPNARPKIKRMLTGLIARLSRQPDS